MHKYKKISKINSLKWNRKNGTVQFKFSKLIRITSTSDIENLD